MSELKCPFCDSEIEQLNDQQRSLFHCSNIVCCKGGHYIGNISMWRDLIRTRKALNYAIDVIQTVAKMSNKLSREYGETLVEQLDNIQAYCWQEGYVLTYEEDLSKALEQKDVK